MTSDPIRLESSAATVGQRRAPSSWALLLLASCAPAAGSGVPGAAPFEDVLPPSIDCPLAVSVDCAGPEGTLVAFSVAAQDDLDPTPTVVCTPPSGAVFPIGATTVQCSATDDAGNESTCAFVVTVGDTSPPEIHTAPVRVQIALGLTGAFVSFAPEVFDLCDLSPGIVCTPPSGSFFPVGVSPVTCTATDAAGNQSVVQFSVRVKPTLGTTSGAGAGEFEAGLPPGWYSGDTHEHIQHCDESEHSSEEVLARMNAEDLNVASVLIWHREQLPYTRFVCAVSGVKDALSTTRRFLQYGVETSGLDCSRWGHLIGLGIGPAQARIALGSVQQGDCEDMPGLGLGGDGSGTITAPIAELFLGAEGAVCGYAHTFWTPGLYNSQGFDWATELLASGFTTDALYLDALQRLSVPKVYRLMGITAPPNSARAFMPLLGAMDAVLGNVQFFETVKLGDPSSFRGMDPPVVWYAMAYKLLSAGVRVAISGGTDRACQATGTPDYPRTYVLVDETLSYGSWTRGLAAGRTSVAAGAGTFLRLTVNGAEVGSDVALASPNASCTATVELRSAFPVDDCIELIVDGEVRDSRPVVLAERGTVAVTFGDVPFAKSAWVTARLCSQRAHTGFVYVIVDGRPVGDPASAEYWMLWCDIVTKLTLDHPELVFFGYQEGEALALIANARDVFKALRDAAGDGVLQGVQGPAMRGAEPRPGIVRYGVSGAGCSGPIAIGVREQCQSGEELRFTCVHAPPFADGVLEISRVEFSALADSAPSLLSSIPVRSTRGGYAEALLPRALATEALLHARFVWKHPSGCHRTNCGGAETGKSSSDAVRVLVRGVQRHR